MSLPSMLKNLGAITAGANAAAVALDAAGKAAAGNVAIIHDAAAQLQSTAQTVSATIATNAATAVQAAGTAIASKVSEAMKGLLDLVAGGNQSSQNFGNPMGTGDYGSQFAGQTRDEQGNVAGGAIGDATYATWVQAYLDSKKRYADDYNTPGQQGFQFQEGRQMQQLEMMWYQLGGFARFGNETLAQIADAIAKQTSAIGAVAKSIAAPPSTSTARLQIYLPKSSAPPAAPLNHVAQFFVSRGIL